MKKIVFHVLAAAVVAMAGCKKDDVAVSSVTIDPASHTLGVGETVTLTAKIFPDDATNKEVTWSVATGSDVVTIATDDNRVTVTASKLGNAKITVTTRDGSKKFDCSIKVDPVVPSGVSLSPEGPVTLTEVGQTQVITPTVSPNDATDQSVRWETDNPDVATVADGTVTAVSSGTANIYAITCNNKIAACAVTVAIPVEEVVLEPTSLALNINEEAMIVAAVSPDVAPQTVTWTSDKDNVASVTNGSERIIRRNSHHYRHGGRQISNLHGKG